jgi:signal transduction histidine kinase
MFSSLRKRITALFLGSAVLVLVVLLCVVFASNYASTRNQSMTMLDRYVSLYSLENPPGSGDGPSSPLDMSEGRSVASGVGESGMLPPNPPLGDDSADYSLSSFYSVSFGDSGEVLFVDTGSTGLYSQAELVDIAGSMVQRGPGSGSTGTMLYEVVRRDGYTLVAFIDNRLADNSMRTLIVDMLVGAGVSLLLVLLISFPLGRALVRPLEENDARQRRFISDAGHELKTPVSVIGVNAELLSRQLGENKWLDNIQYENRRMGELVTQLLKLSRAQERNCDQQPVNLSQMVETEAAPFESMANDAGLELVCAIQDGLWVQGDAAQLAQMLSILLDNAIAYSRGGGSVGLTLGSEHRIAILEVVNSAEGLDARSLDQAFERFFRADEARSDAEGHYGLGLSIAKAIVEGHRGTIALESRDGEVHAMVRLPLKR